MFDRARRTSSALVRSTPSSGPKMRMTTAWLAPDVNKIAAIVDLYCNCVNAYGDFRVSTDNQRAANRDVGERDLGLYVQADGSDRFYDAVFGASVDGALGDPAGYVD